MFVIIMRAVALALLAFFATLLVSGAARAEERPRARLTYTTIAGCPDAAHVETLVKVRLGYDPFVVEGLADRIVRVRIERRGKTFAGTVDVASSAESQGKRELTSADCAELVEALSMTIAVGIDPLSIAGPPAPAMKEANPPPVAPPRSSAEDPFLAPRLSQPPDAQQTPPTNEPRLRIHAGPLLSLGAAPVVNAGLALGAGARWRTFSLGGEGRIDFPTSSHSVSGGQISASVVLGSAVPCAHVGIFRACALVSAGVLRAAGEGVSTPRRTSNFYSALGGRAGVELPLVEWLALEAHVDLLATLTRITLELDRSAAWKTPPASGAGGISLAGTF